MLNNIYNQRILELAGNIPRIGRLPQPDATASAYSKLCGSTITVDLKLRDGKVADYAEPVRDYKARHGSTMLAFDAVADAVEKMVSKENPSK
ncbi:MAG: iron-sulfur cluster assembly scaffold protein [Methylocystis sp.]|nr:iron-sulfur cluster assembly scaffold protein [Methylocystis sp.]